jgi:hypothetical protein
MMSHRPIALWAALVMLPLPPVAAQQPTQDTLPWSCTDTSVSRWLTADAAANRGEVEERELLEHYLARTYAPVLRFAPTERYFPTIPFYTAFQPEAGRIVPLSDSLGLPLISGVRQAYDSSLDRTLRPHEVKLPVPVVFYRVCDFTESVDSGAALDSAALQPRWSRKAWHLWDYLRSDEQAWHRFGMEKLSTSDTNRVDGWGPKPDLQPGSLVKGINRFRVIQYFVYYLQDWGLMGHSEDIEYAFVFVPKDTVAAKSFRVIVGAGHDPPAPNNVLVLTGREASKRRHYHPNILVELGGHSSAPDMPPLGQFSAGLDVNWHIDDIWGTRDEQATAGLSFSGRYEGTMTYPRDPEDAVTLFPRGLGTSGEESRQLLADLVRVSPDYLAERAHRASHRTDLPSAEQRAVADSILHDYRAVVQESEAEVHHAVGRSDSAAAIRRYGEKSEVYQSEIGKAVTQDVESRDSALARLNAQRLDAIQERVRRRLRLGGCPEGTVDEMLPCGKWLGDSLLERRTAAIVKLLEQSARRIPSDSLMAYLLAEVPDTSQRSQLDAITTEIRQVVTERLQPEYTLLPIRYLQALYRGAIDSNPAMVNRHAKLITRLLHPAVCDELACGLSFLRGEAFDSAFDEVVCGHRKDGREVRGVVHWGRSLACRLDDSTANTAAMLDSLRMWDMNVYDLRRDGFGKSREWPGYKHKIWEHKLYREPEQIFRTNLFRPTSLQVRRSRGSFWSLFHLGYNLDFGRASNPYVGLIIPAFRALGKVPGYVAVQAGPYLGQPYRGADPSVAVSLLYDRQFVYFYGLFLKAQWAPDRSEVEGGSGASDFAWTFGASLWAPIGFLKRIHVRPGLRFDTDDLKPLLERSVFELQIEYRR